MVLWVTMLVAMAGIGMVSPLLPIYVRDTLHGPAIGVALSFSGLALAQLIASPFVGRLGDRIGTKPFIVAGFFIYAVGAIGYVFAPTWHFVVLFRILSGFGAAGIFPMALAYVGRMSPTGREGQFMGIYSVAQLLGFGLGPLLGGGVRDALGANAAFTSMALLLGGTGLATLLLLPPERIEGARPLARTRDTNASWRSLIARPAVQAAFAVQMVVSLGWGAASTFLGIFVISPDGLGTDSAFFVGVLLAVRSVLSAVLQPVFGPLADKADRLLLVVTGLTVTAVLQFLIPSLPRDLWHGSLLGEAITIAPWLFFTMCAIGIFEGLQQPAQQAIFVTVGRRVGMSSIMGLNQMGNSIGFLSGSLVGAFVVSTWGLDAVFRYAGIVTLAGGAAFAVLMLRAREDMRDAPAVLEPAIVSSEEKA
ncbi:MAG: MFS transporter [Chloroflexi bacterium]|nr:MAG: MFS transporter [Chloroflexota bacterium]